jgi:hypothetical protein
VASYTIGTGGDYSSMQAWEDASPATLTERWEGRLMSGQKHGHPSLATILLYIAGQTTTAALNMKLTYDGAANYHGGNWAHATAPRLTPVVLDTYSCDGIQNATDHTTIEGLILMTDRESMGQGVVHTGGSGTRININECILFGCNDSALAQQGGAGTIYARNCLMLYCYMVLVSNVGSPAKAYLHHITALHCGSIRGRYGKCTVGRIYSSDNTYGVQEPGGGRWHGHHVRAVQHRIRPRHHQHGRGCLLRRKRCRHKQGHCRAVAAIRHGHEPPLFVLPLWGAQRAA